MAGRRPAAIGYRSGRESPLLAEANGARSVGTDVIEGVGWFAQGVAEIV
jgi:hypothetical protein